MNQQDLPPGWATVAVAEVLSCVETGKRPRGGAVKDTSGVLSISAEHMDATGGIDTSIPRFVPHKFYETMTTGRLQPGDVLVVKDGATTGKTAYFSGNPEGSPIVVNEHVFICRPLTGGIIPRWLFYCLWGEPSQSQIRACFRGSAQGGIIRSFVNEVTLPLPPLAEQRRIVAAIETQFARLDASVAALRRAQANLKRYRASVLKDACQGRLVPAEAELARSEGRDYESAAVLLERILAQRRTRWESKEKRRGKYREPSAPDASALPELPEGWVWATVGACLSRIQAGKNFKCEERPPHGQEYGVVKVSSVTWGEFNESESKTCLDPSKIDSSLLIEPGDFLFSRANTIQLVGACVIAGSVGLNVMLSDKILRFTVIEVLQEWLLYCLRSTNGRNEIERLATGNQESMRNIGQDRIREIRFPLPPLAEQRRIVAEVERRLSVAQQAEDAVAASLKRAGRLRQSILKQAFSGKLVPQDPCDEPASALLERIRAEREAEAQAPGKGKSGRGKRGVAR